MTNKEFEMIDISIKKTIKDNKSKLVYLDLDDVHSELWVSAMTLYNKYESVNSSLLLKAFHAKVVDLIRKYNKKQFKDDYIIDNHYATDSDDDSWMTYTPRVEYDFDHNLEVEDMINLFPEGSKERDYVLIALNIVGERNDWNLKKDYKKVTQGAIAYELGYASGCSNGFRRVRNNVQEAFRMMRNQELGILEW